MDMNKMVLNALGKIDSDGIAVAAVEKTVTKTVESIVDDLFGKYSDFGKNLKTEVEAKLELNLDKLNIQSYNHMVMNVIQRKLEESVTIVGAKQLEDELDNLLGSGEPPKMKLSALIEMLKSGHEDDEDYFGQNVSFHISRSYCLYHIYFDVEEGKESFMCDYRLSVNTDSGVLTHVKIHDRAFDNALIMGGLYGIEAALFKIYTMKGTLEVDVEEGDDVLTFDDPTD